MIYIFHQLVGPRDEGIGDEKFRLLVQKYVIILLRVDLSGRVREFDVN